MYQVLGSRSILALCPVEQGSAGRGSPSNGSPQHTRRLASCSAAFTWTKGEFAAAIESLERGLSWEPSNAKLRLRVADAYRRSGEPERALQVYRAMSTVDRFVTNSDVAGAWRGRGDCLADLGEFDSAEMAFRESLKCEPNHPDALAGLASIECRRESEPAPASRSDLSPTSHEAECGLCGASARTGHTISMNGRTVPVCDRCHSRRAERWWA